jgi:hypothetical protein
MTHDKHKDTDIAGFVTKVMEMAPDAPAYPEPAIVSETAKRRMPSWAWPPVAAVAVLLVVVPISMRGGTSNVPELPFTAAPQTESGDQSTDLVIDDPAVIPDVEAERNTLVFGDQNPVGPVTISQGGQLLVDFTGENNKARSALFWMDRFDYAGQQWLYEWILWSDRCDDCSQFVHAITINAATITVLTPEADVVIDGFDRLTIPTDLPLGTYRVCVGAGDGGCGVFEVSDEGSGVPGELVPISAEPPTEVPFPSDPTPEFGAVALTPEAGVIVVTPHQFLIGPDAALIAIADGFIGEGEELPNGFYIRPILEGIEIELEIAGDFEAFVVDPTDPDEQITLDFADWVDWFQTSGGPQAQTIWMYLTYTEDGKVSSLTEQYTP